MSKLIAQAQAAERAGRWVEAEKAYKAALRETPNDPHILLALLKFSLIAPGALPGAFPPLNKLLAMLPKSELVHRLAAQAYYLMGDVDRGLTHARKGAALAPKEVEARYILATILDRAGLAEEALTEINCALDLSPKHRHSLKVKAQVLISLGQMEPAAALCKQLHAMDPNDLTIYSLYSRTGKLSPDDPLVHDLTDRLLPLAKIAGAKHAASAYKVIAKLQGDQGNHTEAFTAYVNAKAADPQKSDYSTYRKYVDSQVNGISRADFFGWQGAPDTRPVFIVGMPRSGSTLLEQILSGHGQIGGIGESTAITQIARSAGIAMRDGAQLVKAIKETTPDRATDLAGVYSTMLGQMQPGKDRVVDKFLHNFEQLGFIARLFPKAHILHARRDPMDNCVSCFMSNLSTWHSYTDDLTTMGQFYRDHVRLMDHWKKVLPNPIMDVCYEDVVADTEGMARKIIGFLGLDWDPNCLKFQENENKARTLSAWQVRQPIYTTSVKRWKRYEEFLDPLKAELKGFYPDGF